MVDHHLLLHFNNQKQSTGTKTIYSHWDTHSPKITPLVAQFHNPQTYSIQEMVVFCMFHIFKSCSQIQMQRIYVHTSRYNNIKLLLDE